MIDLRAVLPPEPPAFLEPEPADAAEQRAWKRLREARDAVVEAVGRGEHPESRDFQNLWSDYKHFFRNAQHGGKCAFCETRIGASQPGDVEHYRPKTAIREPLEPGNRDDTGGRPSGRAHGPESRPGYWWLAYEWSNYLYACNRCNRAWKRNSFPLNGERVAMEPGVEAGEEPLLLNPFQTDPEPHFEFDEFGQIHGRTEHGRVTIDRCGLDRQSLIHERFQVAERVQQLFGLLEEGLLNAEAFDRLIEPMLRDEAEYAALARSLSAQWLEALEEPDED